MTGRGKKILLAVCLAAAALAAGLQGLHYGPVELWEILSHGVQGNKLSPEEQAHRNPEWAEPLELAGVENLHRVSAALYRGAQPTAEGMASLKQLGIKTIINLRDLHSDRDEIGDNSFNYIHIRFNAFAPSDENTEQFLRALNDPANLPAFVHCAHGADRTGTMCALYRIFFQGWDKEKAITELTEGGYNFHGLYQNLVAYLRDLDVEAMRQRAGIPPPPVPAGR